MMNKFFTPFLLLVLAATIYSCSKGDSIDPPEVAYDFPVPDSYSLTSNGQTVGT